MFSYKSLIIIYFIIIKIRNKTLFFGLYCNYIIYLLLYVLFFINIIILIFYYISHKFMSELNKLSFFFNIINLGSRRNFNIKIN